jgi:hypothetical protein
LEYASDDVVYLIPSWLKIKSFFNKNLNDIIYFLTILKVAEPDLHIEFKDYLISHIFFIAFPINPTQKRQSILSQLIAEEIGFECYLDFESYQFLQSILSIDYVFVFLRLKSFTIKKSITKSQIIQSGLEAKYESSYNFAFENNQVFQSFPLISIPKPTKYQKYSSNKSYDNLSFKKTKKKTKKIKYF